MSLKDVAEKMVKAKASGGGNYIEPGKYTLIVREMIYDDHGFQGDNFIVEFFVEQSESYPGETWPDGKPRLANPPGSTCSIAIKFNSETENVAFPNLKRFWMGLNDIAENDITDGAAVLSEISDATGKDQPMRGARVRCETYKKTSKKSGKLLHLPKWIPVKQTPEQILKTRQWLETAATVATQPTQTQAQA
jgi:predicted DNA-binding ribbon-helix-helix protein